MLDLTPRGKILFRFVVVADTHVNQEDGISSSPYETNKAANARARHVFLDIAAMDPAPQFVIHLGDIVNPVPSLPTFAPAVENFKEIIQPVKCPVHVLPGNHDVGDKRIDWMPADQVCNEFLDSYRKAFGPDYYAFDDHGSRFILLNSLLINSGLEDEKKQKEWLEAQLETADSLRVFLFMHYPPFIYSTSERSNYDNLDEPGRSWLIKMMSHPRVEASFAGHVHNFWYERTGDAEFYMLPSTAFLRHDFTEFSRVRPENEFGRGDLAKFGYFVVDLYENGHVAYSVRTHGRQAAKGEAPTVTYRDRYLTHPKVVRNLSLGVELRHPWAETMQITSTGGVQEFGRKWARNDYPLQALWEMGAALNKIPDIDLEEQEPRRRLELMASLGHRFIVTSLGVPKPHLLQVNPQNHGLLGFEVNLTSDGFSKHRQTLADIRRTHNTKIFFSKLLTADPSQFDGKHFSHFVRAGLQNDELPAYVDAIKKAVSDGVIDGVTVRLEHDEDMVLSADSINAFADQTGAEVLVSVKLAGPSIARERADDPGNMASLLTAFVLSKCHDRVRYVYDTFMDVDRGYFPRHAFIDRHFNPRPMALALGSLNAIFPDDQRFALVEASGDTSGKLVFTTSTGNHTLLWGTDDEVRVQLSRCGNAALVRELCHHEASTDAHTGHRAVLVSY